LAGLEKKTAGRIVDKLEYFGAAASAITAPFLMSIKKDASKS